MSRRGQSRHRTAKRLTGAAAAAAMALTATAVAPRPAASDGELSAALVQRGKSDLCIEPRIRTQDVVSSCQLLAVEAPMSFTVVSLFGEELLARCPISFSVHVGSTGSLVVGNIASSQISDDVSGPCGDILACRRVVDGPEEDKLPWKGRLVPSSSKSFRAELDPCFDTCLGRFEGSIDAAFEQTAKRTWTLRVHSEVLGASGLEISGSWVMSPAFGGRLTIDAK